MGKLCGVSQFSSLGVSSRPFTLHPRLRVHVLCSRPVSSRPFTLHPRLRVHILCSRPLFLLLRKFYQILLMRTCFFGMRSHERMPSSRVYSPPSQQQLCQPPCPQQVNFLTEMKLRQSYLTLTPIRWLVFRSSLKMRLASLGGSSRNTAYRPGPHLEGSL